MNNEKKMPTDAEKKDILCILREELYVRDKYGEYIDGYYVAGMHSAEEKIQSIIDQKEKTIDKMSELISKLDEAVAESKRTAEAWKTIAENKEKEIERLNNLTEEISAHMVTQQNLISKQQDRIKELEALLADTTQLATRRGKEVAELEKDNTALKASMERQIEKHHQFIRMNGESFEKKNAYIRKLEAKLKECELPRLEKGDKIKLYGKETTVVGFTASYNDALNKYEIILLTTGRSDPFYRTLDQIELLTLTP